MAFIPWSEAQLKKPTAIVTLVNYAKSTLFCGLMFLSFAALAPFSTSVAADSSQPAFTRTWTAGDFKAQGTTAAPPTAPTATSPPSVRDIDAAKRELQGLSNNRAASSGGALSMPSSSAAAPSSSGSVLSDIGNSGRRGLDNVANTVTSAFSSDPGAGATSANRRTELQAAVSKWTKAVEERDAHYQALKSQLAQIEATRRELDGIDQMIAQLERQKSMAERTDQQAEMADLAKQIEDLRSRRATADAQLNQVGQRRNALANAADTAALMAHSAPTSSMPTDGDIISGGGGGAPGTIQPGDKLEIMIQEDPSLGGVFEVTRSGSIYLPDIGTVNVMNQGEAGAAELVRQQLEGVVLVKATVTTRQIPEPRQETTISSQPTGPAPEVFTIIYLAGEFITPGSLRIPETVTPTLLQTIIRSGGITPSGDLTRVKLLRIGDDVRAVEEVNVAGILSGNLAPNDIQLEPNDIIVIPPFAPVVYVTGNVERAGTLRLFQDETLTAYAAILRAGGFSRFANLRKVYVVRDLGNGEKTQIPVNIRDVQKGKAPDVILQGKDIVVVPERFFSF